MMKTVHVGGRGSLHISPYLHSVSVPGRKIRVKKRETENEKNNETK
jgi:hypothetical protein